MTFGDAAYYKRLWLLARERATFAEEWAEGWENRADNHSAWRVSLERLAESRKAQVTEYGKVVERQRAEIESLKAQLARIESRLGPGSVVRLGSADHDV